jgi:hypothetical protein
MNLQHFSDISVFLYARFLAMDTWHYGIAGPIVLTYKCLGYLQPDSYLYVVPSPTDWYKNYLSWSLQWGLALLTVTKQSLLDKLYSNFKINYGYSGVTWLQVSLYEHNMVSGYSNISQSYTSHKTNQMLWILWACSLIICGQLHQ